MADERFVEGPSHVFCPHGTFVEPARCRRCPPPKERDRLVVTEVDRETGSITFTSKH